MRDTFESLPTGSKFKPQSGGGSMNNTRILNQSNISKEEMHSNLQEISKEMQKHAEFSKNQHLNNTVKDILSNLQEEDQKFVEFADKKGRNSILDLDMLKTNRGKPPVANKKKKKRPSSSGVNKSQDDSMSSGSYESGTNQSSFIGKKKKEITPNFQERNKSYMQKKQYNLDIQRNKKREKENSKHQEKPKLTKNTIKIINERNSKEKPLYLRTQEVLERKNNKLENLKRLYTELDKPEDTKESNLARNLYSNLNTQDDFNEWVNRQAVLQKRKEDRIESMKKDMNRLETESENMFFKPTINKTSEILVSMKTQGDIEFPKKKAYERLYSEHENQMMRQHKLYNDHIPSFLPTTHKNKPNYLNSRLSFLGGGDAKSTVNSLRSSPNKNKQRLKNSKALSNSAVDIDTTKMNIFNGNNNSNNPGFTKTTTAGFRSGSLEKTSMKNTLDSNKGKNWEDMIDNVNNVKGSTKNLKKNSETDYLYKLNIRSAAAWDKDKENFIYLNPKFTSIVNKILK